MKVVKIKNRDKSYTIGKIICLGRNYVEHIIELGNTQSENPVIFLRPPSNVVYSGDKIVYPGYSNDMHHETELLLLIGKTIKNAGYKEAEEAIIGYGVGLDMTLRDIQNHVKSKGHPWEISKCFDTSAVVSEFIAKEDYTVTLEEKIILTVNGEIRQNDPLNKMILKPVEAVMFISKYMTIEEGDIVFTGTPAGVSKVEKGDKLKAEITNIGSLEVEVI